MRSSITTRRRAAAADAGSTLGERRPGGRFGRHQVAELPPISVIVVEHRTHRLRCSALPAPDQRPVAGARSARSAFGPRLQAAVVTLTARTGSRAARISELARELFGARLSTGAVDAICQRASDALAGPHLQLAGLGARPGRGARR